MGSAVTSTASTNQEVEAFLERHTIEPHAADMLRGMSPGLQQMVVNIGALDGSRDQTAALMSRIGQAKSGNTAFPELKGPNGQEAKDGDWYCPGCNDLQFKRNAACRRCGTSNPSASSVSAALASVPTSNPGAGSVAAALASVPTNLIYNCASPPVTHVPADLLLGGASSALMAASFNLTNPASLGLSNTSAELLGAPGNLLWANLQ